MLDLLQRFGWSIALLVAGLALLGAWAAPHARAALARRSSSPWRWRRSSPASPVAEVARDAEELATRLAAHLDAKAERLERLIEAADARLAALEELADAGMLTPAPESPAHRAVGAVTIEPDPLSRRVYELADAGKPPPEIARALGEHIGKVQLILALRG